MTDSKRTRLLEQLRTTIEREGYECESPAVAIGRLGVAHNFDLSVREGSEGAVFADFVSSSRSIDEVEVIKCYVKSFETNPGCAILIAYPSITEMARRLAMEYKILVPEAPNVETVSQSILHTARKCAESERYPGLPPAYVLAD